MYMEDGLFPKESFQRSHPSPSTDQREVTHVDETTFPQISNSVNNSDSQIDLASVSMDPTSRQMVDDLVDSEMADDKPETPSKPGLVASSPNEVGNDTSYGLFGTSTASELEARANFQNQHPVIPSPLLPSIYNSPFAPQPGENATNSRPGTAKRTTPNHSQQISQVTFPLQQPIGHEIESSQSSMPEPTNPNPPIYEGYRNQPFVNATFPTKTSYTTGRTSSTVYGNGDYSTLDGHLFVSPTIDFGCSGSIADANNIQTPPNGQGAG